MSDPIYNHVLDWGGVVRAVDQFIALWRTGHTTPPPSIRLTREQLGQVREVIPDADLSGCPAVVMFGVPVVLVDDFEDSTPFELAIEKRWSEIRRIEWPT